MAEENEDWLFPDKAKQRAQIKEKGLIFAQKFLVFAGQTADPRARDLLETWTQLVRRTPIRSGSSAQEYAAANALREFVEGIHAQIEFANQGVNVPQPRTK